MLKLVLPSVSTLRKCAVILTGYCSSRRARTKKTYFGFSDVFIIVNGFQLFPTRKKSMSYYIIWWNGLEFCFHLEFLINFGFIVRVSNKNPAVEALAVNKKRFSRGNFATTQRWPGLYIMLLGIITTWGLSWKYVADDGGSGGSWLWAPFFTKAHGGFLKLGLPPVLIHF